MGSRVNMLRIDCSRIAFIISGLRVHNQSNAASHGSELPSSALQAGGRLRHMVRLRQSLQEQRRAQVGSLPARIWFRMAASNRTPITTAWPDDTYLSGDTARQSPVQAGLQQHNIRETMLS